MTTPPPARHPDWDDQPDQDAGQLPVDQSLRRELLAIAVLYVILSILPLVIGLVFAP